MAGFAAAKDVRPQPAAALPHERQQDRTSGGWGGKLLSPTVCWFSPAARGLAGHPNAHPSPRNAKQTNNSRPTVNVILLALAERHVAPGFRT
jgi:hypothetical protein